MTQAHLQRPASEPPGSGSVPPRFGWWLGLATVVGLLVRLVHLDTTIAFDEAITVRRFVEGGVASIFSLYGGYGSTNNHVLNSLVSLASVRLFGEHVWALRLPALVFGVCTVPLLGVFARDVTRRLGQQSFRIGWLAAFLAALSPILVEYAPACRGYAPLLFFSVLGAWLCLRLLDGRARGWLGPIGFGLVLFACGWSHMSALVFLAALGSFLGLQWLLHWRSPQPDDPSLRQLLLALALPLGLATLALVAWYSRASLILRDVQSRVVTGEFVDPSLAGLKSVHDDTAFLAWILHTGKDFFGTRGIFLPLLVPLVLLGAGTLARSAGRRGWLVLCAAVLPPLALLAARLLPFPRYFLFVQPFVLVLLAVGIASLARWLATSVLRAPARAGLTAVVLLCACQAMALQRLGQVLLGPGSKGMGVAWDAARLAEGLTDELEPADLVLSLPQPLRPAEWRERGFYQSYEFHEQNDVLPLLTPWSEGTLSCAVWYASPHGSVRHPEFLPAGVTLQPFLNALGCTLFRGDYTVTLTERAVPEPQWASGQLGSWTFTCPFDNADFRIEETNGERSTRRLSLLVEESGSDAELASPAFDVRPGGVLALQTAIAAEQPGGMRPFGRIGLHFYDEEGVLLTTRTRPGPLWPDLRPTEGWTPLEVRTAVPRTARTARIFFALTLGNHVGCTIHVRPLRLLEG